MASRRFLCVCLLKMGNMATYLFAGGDDLVMGKIDEGRKRGQLLKPSCKGKRG